MARALVVVVAASVVGAGAWFAVGPGAGPPTAGCSDAPSLPSTARLPAPAARAIEWREADLPDELVDADEQIITDVVSVGDGFVAVGRSSDGPDSHALLLRSSDGLTWRGGQDDAVRFAGTDLAGLAVVGDRVFAIGSTMTDDRGGSRAAVWFSDDAETWVEAAGPFADRSVRSIAGGDDGLLLIGSDNASGHPVAWRSEDGAAWEASTLDLPVALSEAGISSVSSEGTEWRAVGWVSRGADAAAAPVAWRSSDGVAWTCHVLDAGGFGRALAFDLHGQGGRWLAVGDAGDVCRFGQCVGHEIAWASRDFAWGQAMTEPQEPVGLNPVYAALADGFVAAAREATFLSADGISWTRIADSAHPDAAAASGAALAGNGDSRLVLVGVRYDGSDADAWVVVGTPAP